MHATLLILSILSGGNADSLRIAVAPSESLRVVVAGTGAPVVLVPGLAGTAFAYRHVSETLVADGWRVVVIEPLGIGGSDRPPDADYSLTAQADRVAAVLDTLGIDSAILVAHSIGASVVFRLAYRHPHLVRAIVSIEGGPAESATGRGFRRLMTFAPLLKLLGRGGIESMIAKELRAASADTAWIDETIIAAYSAHAVADVGKTLDAYQAMARAEEPESLSARLPEIQAPVVLLVGAARHKGGPTAAEIEVLQTQVPSIVVQRVANAGHYIHEERPEAVVGAIRRLTASPADAPTRTSSLPHQDR